MKLDRQESGVKFNERAEDQCLPLVGNDGLRPATNDPSFGRGTDIVRHARQRSEYRWSKGARDLIRQNLDATGRELTALVTTLVEESGNPRLACWRFARRMGIQARRKHRPWTVLEQQRLLKLIDLHPIKEIARLLRRSQSSIWHMLQRLGANAKMGKDSFTKYTLGVALHVRPETVEGWIVRGWLKAREVEAGQGRRVIIQAEDFCEFCREHTRDVVGNRLTKERLDFVYHFAFPASHAELLPVRESKKERFAYDEHGRITVEQKKVVQAADSDDGDDKEVFLTA